MSVALSTTLEILPTFHSQFKECPSEEQDPPPKCDKRITKEKKFNSHTVHKQS